MQAWLSPCIWLPRLSEDHSDASHFSTDTGGCAAVPRNCATSLFELVIRDVGGLLAAYDLSGDRMFVTRWGTLDMACSPPPAESSLLCLRPERNSLS